MAPLGEAEAWGLLDSEHLSPAGQEEDACGKASAYPPVGSSSSRGACPGAALSGRLRAAVAGSALLLLLAIVLPAAFVGFLAGAASRNQARSDEAPAAPPSSQAPSELISEFGLPALNLKLPFQQPQQAPPPQPAYPGYADPAAVAAPVVAPPVEEPQPPPVQEPPPAPENPPPAPPPDAQPAAPPGLPPAGIAGWTPPPTGGAPGPSCSERGQKSYSLAWEASGANFWDQWNFLTTEPNSGAARYVSSYQEGVEKGVIAATPGSATLRPGAKADNLKRWSAKVETKQQWKYFLAVFKFNHVPWGCGIWPAVWTHTTAVPWPNGGELDIIEYCNEEPSRSSFHVGLQNHCKLNQALLSNPGCPEFKDAEKNFTGDSDCVTNYPTQIGCAPNVLPLKTGEQLASQPHIVAAQWTESFVKIFFIPAAQMPADLASGAPQPDNWDQYLVTYYPLAASEASIPGSCPNPANIIMPQQIVINLGFCGDWSAKVWMNSTMCANRPEFQPRFNTPKMPDQCYPVDPHDPVDVQGNPLQPAGPRDCCTQYIYDANNEFGTEGFLQANGHFDIEWLRVYQ